MSHRCHILWHLCEIHVTSMSQQLREEWRPYDRPPDHLCSWGGLHSSLLLQLCFSFVFPILWHFISFKQIYFINICLPNCLIFTIICRSPLVFNIYNCLAPGSSSLHSWQSWCQNANFAPSKEIYQISGLHTRRYRFPFQPNRPRKSQRQERKGSYFSG